ncbi:MAG TPA: carboxypeptidase-like regulatory domain-containing protein [Planctomycetota bacterium]|nr:carboxypeptidase-like regulatory domain-containing protein [Planctomycetota bacterium]
MRVNASGPAFGAALAIAVVVVSLSLRNDGEDLLPPAAEQAAARVPHPDSPYAEVPDPDVLALDRIDSAGSVAHAAAPAVLPCRLDGRACTSDGRAVPNATVFLVARGNGGRQRAITGPDGRFEFRAAPGPHALVVPPLARLLGIEQEVELRPEVTRVEIALPRLATAQVEGRIVDTEGLPLSDTRAVLHTASAPRTADFVETDRGGWFRLADVPVGDLVLRTSEPIRAEVRGHELVAGQTKSLQFVIDIGCHSLAGQVVAEGGTPGVGAQVRLDRSFTAGNGIRCVSTRTLVTDQNGCFVFEHLGPGPGNLTVMASGCATEVVDIEPGTSPVVVVHRIAN